VYGSAVVAMIIFMPGGLAGLYNAAQQRWRRPRVAKAAS
jgi:hypothetical protein